MVDYFDYARLHAAYRSDTAAEEVDPHDLPLAAALERLQAAENQASPVLLRRLGWVSRHIFVMDLERGAGAMFPVGGYAREELAVLQGNAGYWHQLTIPFLEWLWEHHPDISAEHLEKVPQLITLPGSYDAVIPEQSPDPDRLDERVAELQQWSADLREWRRLNAVAR